MKVTVNRKTLVRTLKTLKDMSKQDTQKKFGDIVVLHTVENGLLLMATSGTAFLAVTIPAEVEREGKCQVNYRLFELAKAAHDEDVVLSFKDKLSVTTASGLRASLVNNPGIVLPVEQIIEQLGNEETALLVNTEDLSNLADISKAFPPTGDLQWVRVDSTPDGISGSIHGSEYGTLDEFPLGGEGDEMEVYLSPNLLSPILTFSGDRTKLSQLSSFHGFVMVSDPDNDSWWSLIGQITKDQRPAEYASESAS